MSIIEKIVEKKFLLFFCLSFILYGNTLFNGYALDDQFVTEKNYTNDGLKSVKRIFYSYYAEKDGSNNYEYRPLVKLSFAIEHQFFGVKPWVGHFINIVLYAIALFLLFKLLLLIFDNYTSLFSLLIVIVFAAHPTHTEVVASLKNRDILLCFIFCMLTLLYLNKYIKTSKITSLALAIIMSVLAFLSKLDASIYIILAPFILYKKHLKKNWKTLFVLFTFFIGFIILKLIRIVLLDKIQQERILKYEENPLHFSHSFIDNISATFNSLGFYIKSLIIPNNLSSYYGYNTIPLFNFFSFYAFIGYISLIVLIYFFIKDLKVKSPIWYSVVFFGASVSIYLNLIRPAPGIVADRFLFSPSIGWSIFLVFILLKLNNNINLKSFKETSIGFKFPFITILVIYSGMSISRNTDWKNRLTLFEKDSKKLPSSVVLNLLYSNEVLVNITKNSSNYTEKEITQQIKQSILCLNNVLKIDSLNTTALNNLAYLKQNVLNDFNSALYYYKKAFSIDSLKYEVHYNLTYCLYRTGNKKEAQENIIKLYKKGNSENQQVLDLMCYILIDNKDYNTGFSIFSDLVKKQPQNSNLNIILGNFYLATKDSVNAKKCYEIAFDLDKKNTQLIEIISRLSKK